MQSASGILGQRRSEPFNVKPTSEISRAGGVDESLREFCFSAARAEFSTAELDEFSVKLIWRAVFYGFKAGIARSITNTKFGAHVLKRRGEGREW